MLGRSTLRTQFSGLSWKVCLMRVTSKKAFRGLIAGWPKPLRLGPLPDERAHEGGFVVPFHRAGNADMVEFPASVFGDRPSDGVDHLTCGFLPDLEKVAQIQSEFDRAVVRPSIEIGGFQIGVAIGRGVDVEHRRQATGNSGSRSRGGDPWFFR